MSQERQAMLRPVLSLITMLLLLAAGTPSGALAADATPQEEIVCITCHGSLPGRLGEPVKLWRGSIHAANGIACNNCHGGDPKDAANAMSPARGFLGAPKEAAIPDFCGRCHVGVEKDYLQSAHGKALGKGGPTCVTCHGNHLVVKATLDIINEKTCTQCHGYDRARVIKDAMLQTESMIVSIGNRIDSFKNEGVDTERLEKGLFSTRNRFHTLFHDVDVDKVRRESAQINGDLGKITATLDRIAGEHAKRRVVGGVVVAGALLVAFLLYLLRKTYD